MTPYFVKVKGCAHNGAATTHEADIPVPCGKCPACLARRVSAWSYRLMKEEERSDSAYFLTLTYSTAHVDISKNGFMTLNKRDVQLFMKRLRKVHNGKPLKYYIAGEYGGQTNRPHYHAILFNARLDLIAPAWQNGDIHYGTVSGASIGYTLKYMCKPSRIPMHRNDDRVPEFALMSKGLGSNYVTEAMVDYHNATNDRLHIVMKDGRKIAMPRYYKSKIFSEEKIQIVNKTVLEKSALDEQKKRNILIAEIGEAEYLRRWEESKKYSFQKLKKNADSRKN